MKKVCFDKNSVCFEKRGKGSQNLAEKKSKSTTKLQTGFFFLTHNFYTTKTNSSADLVGNSKKAYKVFNSNAILPPFEVELYEILY